MHMSLIFFIDGTSEFISLKVVFFSELCDSLLFFTFYTNNFFCKYINYEYILE